MGFWFQNSILNLSLPAEITLGWFANKNQCICVLVSLPLLITKRWTFTLAWTIVLTATQNFPLQGSCQHILIENPTELAINQKNIWGRERTLNFLSVSKNKTKTWIKGSNDKNMERNECLVLMCLKESELIFEWINTNAFF